MGDVLLHLEGRELIFIEVLNYFTAESLVLQIWSLKAVDARDQRLLVEHFVFPSFARAQATRLKRGHLQFEQARVCTLLLSLFDHRLS